jgi:hypothetical protein
MTEMVPLLAAGRLQTAQYEDIKRLLKAGGVPFTESPRSAWTAYLYVREKDFVRAQQIVRAEYREYAALGRSEWEREWKAVHGSSYLRWLIHRWTCNTRLLWFSILRLL